MKQLRLRRWLSFLHLIWLVNPDLLTWWTTKSEDQFSSAAFFDFKALSFSFGKDTPQYLLTVNKANALVPHIAFPVMLACLVHSLIWCLLLGFRPLPPIQTNCCHLINRGKRQTKSSSISNGLVKIRPSSWVQRTMWYTVYSTESVVIVITVWIKQN